MKSTILLLLALLCSSTAFAQSTAVFLTIRDADNPESVQYWWRDDQPTFGPDEQALFQTLEAGGIQVTKPTDLSRVSRILRQPTLTPTNADNLARVLGAQKVILGDVTVHHDPPLGPLRIAETRLTLKATALTRATGTTRTEALPPIELSTFGRAEPSTTFGKLGEELLRHLKKNAPSVAHGGLNDAEPRLAIPREQGAHVIEAIKNRLAAQPNTKLKTAWITDDFLALEINPDRNDSSGEITALAQSAFLQPFEGFVVKISPTGQVQTTIQLIVEPLPSAL